MIADFTLRLPRLETDFTAEIRLQEKNSHNTLEGEIRAIVLNLSSNGACLLVSELFLHRNHIFFTTLGEGTHTLLFSQPFPAGHAEDRQPLPISARSIWMDRYPHDPAPNFVMGIEFLKPQPRLYLNVKKALKKEPY